MFGMQSSANAWNNFKSDPEGSLNSPLMQMALGMLANRGLASGAVQGLQNYNNMQAQTRELDLREQQITGNNEYRNNQAAATASYRESMLAQQQASMDQAKELAQARMAAELKAGKGLTVEERNFNSVGKLTPEQKELWQEVNGRDAQLSSFEKEAKFMESQLGRPLKPEELWRIKRGGQNFNMGGGAIGHRGADGNIETLVDAETATARDANRSGDIAVSSALGGQSAAAQGQIVGMEKSLKQFEQVLADPDLAGAVGPIDQFTGRIGEAFGSKEGVLGSRVEKLMSEMLLQAGESMSGPMSDGDIAVLREGMPGRGSSPEVIKDWVDNIFKPKLKAAYETSDLHGKSPAGWLKADQAGGGNPDIDALMAKYGTQ